MNFLQYKIANYIDFTTHGLTLLDMFCLNSIEEHIGYRHYQRIHREDSKMFFDHIQEEVKLRPCRWVYSLLAGKVHCYFDLKLQAFHRMNPIYW